MAQVKYCEKCREKISIREMPNGVWLPFDYQTNKLHECKEIKDVKKTPKQQIVEDAIKQKRTLIFHDDKRINHAIIPNKMRNGYVTGYNHLDEKLYKYTFNKMYCIKIAEPNEVEMIIKDYKEKTYGIEYTLVRKIDDKPIIRFYSKENYNIFYNRIKSKQDVVNQIKDIEFLINTIKVKIDITKLRDYSLVNADKKIDISLDILLNKNILGYLDEIHEEIRIKNETMKKKAEEERKQQELERIRKEEISTTFKIIICIIIVILLYFFLK